MRVRDLMTTEVITAERGESLADAVERMLAGRAGSVVVISDADAPVGIVTSSDVLRATLEAGTPLADLTVEEALSEPLVTIEPDAPVNRALDTMADHGIKKLPVIDALSLVGIVTTTDVARELPDYVSTVRNIEAKGSRKHE